MYHYDVLRICYLMQKNFHRYDLPSQISIELAINAHYVSMFWFKSRLNHFEVSFRCFEHQDI